MNRQEAWENLMVLTDEILCGLTYEDMEETANQIKKYATLFKPPTHDPDTGLKGCWHCINIEAHHIEYVIAVKAKGGRPMNMPVDCPYHYCPACGRKLEVE